jgi:hypothetical protein
MCGQILRSAQNDQFYASFLGNSLSVAGVSQLASRRS